MSGKRSVSRIVALGLVAATMLLLSGTANQGARAHRGYSVSTVQGRWGFFDEFRIAGRYGTTIGVIEFDGRGKCSINGVQNGGTVAEPTPVESACSYTLGKDGRGVITADDARDLSFVMTEHGKGIAFIPTERGDYGRGEMRPMGAPVDEATIAGAWSYLHPAELFGVPDFTVGIMKFDGEGECLMKYTENAPYFPRGPQGQKSTCEYEVSASGWGRVGGDYLLIIGGGTGIYFMHGQPGNVGWGELTRM